MMNRLILTSCLSLMACLLTAQSSLLVKVAFLLDGQFKDMNSKDLYYFSQFDLFSRDPTDGMASGPDVYGKLLIKRDTSENVEIYSLYSSLTPMPEAFFLSAYASNDRDHLRWELKKLSPDTLWFDGLTLIKDHENIKHKTCFFDGTYWKRIPAPDTKAHRSIFSDTLVFSFTKYKENGRYWGYGNYFYYKRSDLHGEAIQIASHSGFSYDVLHFAGENYLLICWENCILYKILKVEDDKITLSSSKKEKEEIEIFQKMKDFKDW